MMMTYTKYLNRRLYEPGNARHVTVEDLAREVQSGNTVQVLTYPDRRDVTREVLMDALVQLEQKDEKIMDVPYLLDAIRQHSPEIVENRQ